MSQAGKQSPEVGTIPALPPSTSPALPSCPPKHGQKGAPGLQLGPSCREPGWEPQPGQSKIPSKGSAMEGEPIWRSRARVWWDCGSGHWMDAKGSRSSLCSCSVLWHRARFWEQSWFQGLLGTGRVQGCAALTNATSYIPARALEMGALQDQGTRRGGGACEGCREGGEGCREGGGSTGCWMPMLALGFGQRTGDTLGVVLGAGCPDSVSGEMLCITDGAAECWHHSGHQLLE